MYSEIKAFAFVENKKLYVEFEDGRRGLFDMSRYIVSDFFSPLNDEAYFNRAFLEYGVITWPGGQDISPETVALELVPFELPQGIQCIREDAEYRNA